MNDEILKHVMHVVDDEGPKGSWIRKASRKDAATFRSLWAGVAMDQAQRGGNLVWEERTLSAFFEPLFWAYVNGERPGTVLIAGLEEPQGILMWGATLSPEVVTLRDGPVAHGWGVYVLSGFRGNGISRRLRKAGAKELKSQGFRRVYGTAILPKAIRDAALAVRPQEAAAIESALGAGFEWEEVSGSLYL